TSVRLLSNNSWVSGNSGGDIEANKDTNIRIQFSESMDTSSITVNTSDTNCSGTIVVSKAADNGAFFANGYCVQMSSSPSVSNNNKTFTLDPSGSLTLGVVYKIRVTTGVKDGSGNSMAADNTTQSGFGVQKE
ncbi:uncharacterized protein METZ01_LOCUS445375, partial [marine metagenome]